MQPDERRQSLLLAAAAAFAERGYAASVDDIIRNAGVARGTFYLHFKNKQDAFESLLTEFLNDIRHRIERIDTAPGAPSPLEQLRENLLRVVALLTSRRDMTRILFDFASAANSECRRRVQGFYDGVQALIRAGVEKGIRSGIVRPCDAEIVASCVLGTVKEAVYDTIVTRRIQRDLDGIVDEVLRYGACGILDLDKLPTDGAVIDSGWHAA